MKQNNVTSNKEINNRLNHLYHAIKEREKLRVGDKQWKKSKNTFWSNKQFKEWYNEQEKVCNYCKTTEKELVIINNKVRNKRSEHRGRSLEIDRKNDKKGYCAGNCCLACYWCNNAKTDTFNEKEFKPIGKLIGKILRKKISQ